MDDFKKIALKKWLTDTCQLKQFTLETLRGDASLRQYFRVKTGDQSYVVMVAPTERDECKPFIAISKVLRAKGLLSPEIIVSHAPLGFLLLTDFGDQQLLSTLNAQNADLLYAKSLDSLAALQECREVFGWKIRPFTANFMLQECLLFKEWFLQMFLELELAHHTEKMLSTFFQCIVESAANQPQVFMHRDYHSANLMVLPDNQIGILDFQDAFIGPVTYDLVSLLRDAYIAWPEERVKNWALSYYSQLSLPMNADDFLKAFDLMGCQRHLKAILTFTRKYLRDDSTNYLQHIPRVLHYLSYISERYPETKAFHEFLHTAVFPAYEKVTLACVP
jgi:aminoglycoside/choline kinase family phosphotransferase